jgi:hypothetical protein
VFYSFHYAIFEARAMRRVSYKESLIIVGKQYEYIGM